MEIIMVFLMSALCALCLVDCVPKRRNTSDPENSGGVLFDKRKRKYWFGDRPTETQRKYEEIQRKDYARNKGYYQKWDHVSPTHLEKLCQHYVLKFFTMTTDRKVIPSIMPGLVTLHYQLIKGEYDIPLEPALVSVLQCFYNQSGNKSHYKNYFHYIRSPKSHCLFMVKPIFHNWSHPKVSKDMRIINEFCHSVGRRKQGENVEGTSNELEVVPKYPIGKGQLIRSGETTPENRCKYERDHFMDYLFCKDEYMMWPELNAVSNKVSFCKKFIMKIYGNGPRFLKLEVIPEVRRMETVMYINITKTNNDESRTAIVSVLECVVPKSKNQRHYYFIRSSKPNCVLLVKHVSWNLPRKFGIINRLCDVYSPERENFHFN